MSREKWSAVEWLAETLLQTLFITFFYMLFTGMRGCAEYTYKSAAIRRNADEATVGGDEVPRDERHRDR